MKCYKCNRPEKVHIAHLRPLCNNCFIKIIEKRIRKYIRINKLIKKNDKLLIKDPLSLYFIKKIIKSPIKIINKKGKNAKEVIPWSLDDECSLFLDLFFNKEFNIKNIQKTILKEFSSSPEIYFCPKDGCDEKLADFINSANRFIHCAFFDLDLENIIQALKEKSKKIDVKIVVDEDNYKLVKDLDFVKKDNRGAYMHNKFCIFDNKKEFTGSFNPTIRDAYYNNNNIIIINSEYLAENYEKEFSELWNNIFGSGNNAEKPAFYLNGKRIENYFCPEDNCAEQIEEEINKSQSDIY